MSMQKVSVLEPFELATSRAPSSIAVLVASMARWAGRLAAAVAARSDVDRARRDALRAARRRARDQAAVVALARRYESSQPEFAKDLYAAARAGDV